MRYNDAYKLLYESMHDPNPVIKEIIEGIIKASGRGIPVLINRNPTDSGQYISDNILNPFELLED